MPVQRASDAKRYRIPEGAREVEVSIRLASMGVRDSMRALPPQGRESSGGSLSPGAKKVEAEVLRDHDKHVDELLEGARTLGG